MYRIIILLLIVNCTAGFSQQIAPGQWRDHLPYKKAKRVIIVDEKVYCATENSLFYYNKNDNSINNISRVQGLTGTDIAEIGYLSSLGKIIIVYNDLNIDYIEKNKIINFAQIKNKTGLANKKINNLFIYDKYAYLACGFGIVAIDVDKNYIVDTYVLGSGSEAESIVDVAIDEKYIYAATANKIYRGSADDPFLVDKNRWQTIKVFPSENKIMNIECYSNKLFVILDSETYGADKVVYMENNEWKDSKIPLDEMSSMCISNGRLLVCGNRVYSVYNDLSISWTEAFYNCKYAALDSYDNTIWIANYKKTLIRYKTAEDYEIISPNSPTYPQNTQLDVYDDQLWYVCGSLTPTWLNEYNKRGFAGFYNGEWHSFYSETTKEIESYHDFVNVKINPYNPQQVYVAGWWSGVLQYENDNITVFDDKNSTIQQDYLWPGHCFTYGLAFDQNGNLWITNSRAKRPLSVKKKDGKWKSFELPYVGNFNYYVGDIIVTSWGHKWITVPKQPVLIVFDDNGTIDNESDDRSTTFSIANLVKDNYALIDCKYIYSLVEDNEGNIWLSTDAGPVEITGSQYVFDGNYTIAKKISVPITLGENLAAYVLETEKINNICVDGGNRKWVATQNSGAYLFSPDLTKELYHFTTENSPLLSNTILDIGINHNNGEVFFGTDKGIISYRGYSTQGTSEFEDVYVFPNPVRNDFKGDIIITNLLTNAIVKITDVAGNLVYETRAAGGQATWNGTNLLGHRVSTGIYLVFCSNDDGSKTYVTKLLFIK